MAVAGWVETVPAEKPVAVVGRIELMDELDGPAGGEGERRLWLSCVDDFAGLLFSQSFFKCALSVFSITLKRTERGGGGPSSGNFPQSCSSSSRLNVMVDGRRVKKEEMYCHRKNLIDPGLASVIYWLNVKRNLIGNHEFSENYLINFIASESEYHQPHPVFSYFGSLPLNLMKELIRYSINWCQMCLDTTPSSF